MKAAAQCFDDLREAGDSSVPRQQRMELRSGSASAAAKIRGWMQTLELLELGQLSNSEIEVILREEMPLALSEGIECAKRGGAETTEANRLVRVLGKVTKALEQCLKVRLRASRF